VAAVEGRRLAADVPDSDPEQTSESDRLATVLATCGYEPRVEGPRVTLANCPFHALARDHTELVCGMNLGLVGGVMDGLGTSGLVAELDPGPDRCCVTTRTADG
jgi:predicted ArsR family transcriptional regulator